MIDTEQAKNRLLSIMGRCMQSEHGFGLKEKADAALQIIIDQEYQVQKETRILREAIISGEIAAREIEKELGRKNG